LIVKDHKDSLVPGATSAQVGTDFVAEDEFDATVERAAVRAREIVASIRAGSIDRAPRDGKCPPWCGLAPICRMERGVVDPEDEDQEARR